MRPLWRHKKVFKCRSPESDHLTSLWCYLLTHHNATLMMISQWTPHITVTSVLKGVFGVTSPGDSSQWLLSRVTLRRSVENNNETNEIYHILVDRSDCNTYHIDWLYCMLTIYLLHLMFISNSLQYSQLIYCSEISILDLFLNFWILAYLYAWICISNYFSTSFR